MSLEPHPKCFSMCDFDFFVYWLRHFDKEICLEVNRRSDVSVGEAEQI